MLSKVKKGVELGRKLGQPAKKPPIKASEALGKHEGKTLMITEADRTKVGEGYLGGPGFSSLQLEDPFYRDVGAVWGVGKPSKASTMIAANKRLPEGEVIWSTFIGKPDQHKSNQMVFDSLLKEFKAANKAGNLSDELKDKINNRLASAVDKDGRPIFPADVDITSPKFRNLANTFDRRAVAASVMGGEGVGGKKGQIFDYESIIKSTTDPDLVEAPTGAVGNRLFTLSNEVIQRPDLHPAFPSILTGEDLDVNFSPVLRDLIMRDYIKSMMETKGRMPGQFDYTRGYAPMQLLDEAILTKMQKEGYAEGGAIDHDLKAWHEKNMAKGGEVRMSNGGASEHEGFFESGLPPSPIADEILVGRGVRRKAPRIGEIFETPAQAVQGALGAFGSAGKGALQATVGLPGDIISLGRGIGAAVSPQPGEDRLGAFLRGMEGETGLPTTEDVKKFLDQYGKAPFEQFETLGEFTGVPILAAPKVSGAIGRAAEDVAPYLRDLPVGASIKPVGPGGEKVSINELIRRLEAGEEMTPEEMQKAQYSKAQKEKYAQANIAKAQKEPAPKEEAVKVPANEMGFFSSVEKAAANLKREEGSGDAFLSDIMRFNPSAGELEATGIVDFLKGKKSVTRQEVQDYIDQHNVQIEEVIRGTMLSDEERRLMNDINYRASRGLEVSPEEEDFLVEIRKKQSLYKEPRFEQQNLILPGGENYKEILLKFPMKQNAPVSTEKSAAMMLFENNMKEKYGGETFPSIYNRLTPDEVEKYDMYVREDINNRQTESLLQDKRNNFRTNHWPNDPNTFMHLRMQDMTIGGKKTLVIEEIQSDWHQTGRKKGYQKSDIEDSDLMNKLKNQYDIAAKKRRELYRLIETGDDADPKITMAAIEAGDLTDELVRLSDEMTEIRSRQKQGVPDAPFKKDWYQLGVKRLLKYAADNDYDQVALVGPDEQIRRGSLGTHIDGLIYEKNADGTIKLMAEKGQSVVLDKTVEPKDLDLYVGKDVAKRILDSKETDGTLTGDDLKIGGEGMRQYYGRNYPEYMNKLGKKYGTEAKKTKYTIKEFEPDDVEEVYTGEFDRYGREIMAFKVVDRETGEDIAFEYDFDKVLKEANKKAPATDMWLMDLPAKMKSDVKIGQPFKEGGAVTKDKDLMRWHKIQQLATGGAIKRLAESAKDKPWMKYAKSDKDKR